MNMEESQGLRQANDQVKRSVALSGAPDRHPDTVALLNGLGLDLGRGRAVTFQPHRRPARLP